MKRYPYLECVLDYNVWVLHLVLKSFNHDWGRRLLSRGAITLLISDGWDQGEPKEIGKQMARLQLNSYRLIWLNPLIGLAGYEPRTRGMQAAMPYIDEFRPIHNLFSLQQLAVTLTAIDAEGRPSRLGTPSVYGPHARMAWDRGTN